MFDLRKILNGRMNVPEPDYLPVTGGESYNEGEALVLSAGKLTKCGATAKPTHIAAKTYTAPATGGDPLPCFMIDKAMRFEAPVTFSGAENAVPLVVGAKVTIHTDGMGVTDTTTSGVATIVDTLDAAATGDKVVVIFE